MENRKITLADIFLDVLSKSDDKGTKLAAERIKAAIHDVIVCERDSKYPRYLVADRLMTWKKK